MNKDKNSLIMTYLSAYILTNKDVLEEQEINKIQHLIDYLIKLNETE